MDENEKFDEKIKWINYLTKELIDYSDYYISVERVKYNKKEIGPGDAFFIHYTLNSYAKLILLVKCLDISNLSYLQLELIYKLNYFDDTLNNSLKEEIGWEECNKICVNIQEIEALYLLYSLYIVLDNEEFNDNYLKYLDNQEDLIGIRSTLKRFLNGSRYEKIAYLIESDDDKE